MASRLTRRNFLRQASALAAAAATTAHCRADDRESPPIVDTHQHLWDLKKFRLPWLTKDSKLDRSYVMSDYLAAVKGLNVVQAVYMEVDADPAQHVQEAVFGARVELVDLSEVLRPDDDVIHNRR